jgi:hypothetical protein
MKSDGDKTARRIREITTPLDAQIALARKLREISQNLRQQNAELREFLRETLLASMSRREHRTDKK